MSVIWTVILSAVTGIVAWFATNFLAAPIRRIIDLRGEIIRQTIVLATVPKTEAEVPGEPGHVESLGHVSPETMDRIQAARKTFRDLAAQAKSFVSNEPFAMSAVTHLWRYDMRKAGSALLGVSNTLHQYGGELNAHKSAVEEALRFRATD
jgi:hypothetical protein